MPALAFAEEPGPSADDIKRAAASFDRGRDSYRLENYGEAAEYFEAADAFAPSASALRLAMLSRKAAGQLDRAASHAALALSLYPEDEALRGEAQVLLGEQGSQLGRLRVSCSEACDLLLDNKIVHGKRAEQRELFVLPGTHTVRAAWSQDRSRSQKVTLLAAASETVNFVAPEIPVTPVVTDPSKPVVVEPLATDAADGTARGGWSPAVFWTGVGVTAAGIGATTFLGIRALNEPGKDAVRAECQTSREDCALYKQGLENQTMANIGLGATAAVGVFTIITGIWFTDWSGGEKDLALRSGEFSLRPTFAFGNGATLGATGTF